MVDLTHQRLQLVRSYVSDDKRKRCVCVSFYVTLAAFKVPITHQNDLLAFDLKSALSYFFSGRWVFN